jgi:hypothetical protein
MRRRYDGGVATVAWIGLAVALVAAACSTVLVGVRGVQAWRTFRSFARSTTRALDEVTRSAAAAEAHATALTEGVERLTAATEHLGSSLAELAAIRAAADEARAAVAGLRGSVPRK